MATVVPAILPLDFIELRERLSLVAGLVPLVQIDICDGVFVPRKSWPYLGDAETFEKLLTQEIGFPFWKELDFEIHLMVAHPETVVERWMMTGVTRIIFHVETIRNWKLILDTSRQRFELGVAINLDTPLEALLPYVPDTAVLQCMGIRRIGFQGEPFDDETIPRVHTLRGLYPNATISVDGGVNLSNAPKLKAAGASRLVIGSALLESGNMKETLEQFRTI